MINRRTFMATGTAAFASSNLPLQPAVAADEEVIYINAGIGADSNAGTRQNPLKTLFAAAKRVNEGKGTGPTTIILAEGIYPLDQAVLIKPARSYTKTDRLTIRAESLPDDPDWGPARMPVQLELDQTKRNYLHVKEGTLGSDIEAGLFRIRN